MHVDTSTADEAADELAAGTDLGTVEAAVETRSRPEIEEAEPETAEAGQWRSADGRWAGKPKGWAGRSRLRSAPASGVAGRD